MPSGSKNMRQTLRRRSVATTGTTLDVSTEDVDVAGGGVIDNGVQELVDVEGDAATPSFPQETMPTTSEEKIICKQDMDDDDDDENQPVMKIRRITTPAYAIRRIDRRVLPAEVIRRNYVIAKPAAANYSVRKEQELAPNPNNPHFCFTGHQRLYPYRFYLDLIRRAKRDPSIISLDMPKLRPTGGTIIVYDCHGIDQNRALHNDGYRWGRSKGVKLIQSVGNRLVRTYHFLYDPNNPAGDPSFKKYRFSLKGESYGIMVMHYIGDEKHAAEVSARCMRNNDPMAMLAYSESQPGIEDLHSLHLLSLPILTEESSEEERSKFRQSLLSNIQALQRQLLYENEETFVERVEFDDSGVSMVFLFCYPLVEQLVAVAGYLQQGTPFRTVQLLYHTEPVTVDYHLSTLAFIHPFFEGDQVLPIAFMLSSTASPDRCDDHDLFLSALYDRFNELLHGRFVIITSQSLSYTPDAFPVAEHIRCWDDFKRVKLHYIESQFGGAHINEYANDMNILMSCTYEKLFDEMWGKISACKRYTERPDVYSYFNNVWDDFKFTCSIWHLKNCGIPDADKGVVWRPCKGLSKLVSQLCDSDAQLDTIIISLFLLSNAYRRLFIAGLHQSGAWRLKKCYRERFQQSHLKLPKLPYAPAMENIVMTAFSMCPDRPYKRLSNEGANDGTICVDNEYHNHSNSHSDYPSTSSVLWESHSGSNYDYVIDAEELRTPYLKHTYVRLVSPMTFAVRTRDGLPHVVEATHRDDIDALQWYCSCGLRQRCNHIASVIQKIND